MTGSYLADTSAWNRAGAAPVRERWADLIARGDVAMCSPVRLELLYSARDAGEYAMLGNALSALPQLALDRRTVQRAHDVQAALASNGHHRSASPIDLYIAAIAEVNGVALVHYDRHFDTIAGVTGQAAEWIAPRGTLD